MFSRISHGLTEEKNRLSTTSRLALLAFATETLLAGGNGVAIRFSNRELAPLWGAGLRFTLAATVLVLLMLRLKLAIPRGKEFVGAVGYGLVQFAGAFGFYYYALTEIHAGLGQTLLAFVPLVTVLLAATQRQERLRPTALVASIVGVAGIAIVSFDPWRPAPPLIPLLAVMASVVCFAQALVQIRRLRQVHPVTLNTIGMVSGAVALISASALLREPWVLPHLTDTWVALAYVVVAGSVIVFMLHVFIVHQWSASRAAYVMLLIPLVTIALSSWLDDEPLSAGLFIGCALIAASVHFGALRGNDRIATFRPRR